jgi:hypothetical protein
LTGATSIPSPNGMEGGWLRGREGVREYWTRQWSVTDPHADPVKFSVDAFGRTVVEVHRVVRDLAGKVIADRMVRHIYQFEGGLIESMEIVEP